jgi:hypothetical protein
VNKATSQALTDFSLSCQKYFVCYTFSDFGLQEYAKNLASHSRNHDKTLIVGTGHPDEKRWHATLRIGEAINSSQANGVFSDKIAKAFVVSMYSEWDEVYRPRLAAEVGTNTKAVKSDLMGDLRLIRHCVVHNKSKITDEHNKLKELKWQLSPGHLTITKEMFSSLLDQINKMIVRVEPRESKTVA